MKRHLVDEMKTLESGFRKFLAAQTCLAGKVRNEAGSVMSKMEECRAALARLNDDYLDLTAIEFAGNQLTVNRQYWESLPAGRLEEDAVSQLVRQSQGVLNSLHRASVTIPRIVKFSEADLRFAQEIGDQFDRFKRPWTLFKSLICRSEPLPYRGKCKSWSLPPALDFFAMLARHRLVSVYSVCLVANADGGEGEPIEVNHLLERFRQRDLSPETWFEISYELSDTNARNLINGTWFEAYSYLVCKDMIERQAIDFEIYSRVSYEASQAGKSMSRSDFDLLIGLPDAVMMVECKSGRLTDAEAARVIEKTSFVRDVLTSMRLGEFHFVLVYSPADHKDSQDAIARLRGAGVKVVEPQGLRAHLRERLLDAVC